VDQAVPCCQNPATLTNAQSAISKILALGFYDGPTSGVLQCATCLSVYKFDMLDWDDDHDVRIFRLAALPGDSLTQCVKALAQPESPHWPVWVPSRWNLPSEESREVADRELQRILDRARPAELVVAWVGYGERILAARKVPAADLVNVPDWFSRNDSAEGRDWFSLLGLVRRKGVA
jgi:hypothetical protein